MNLRDELNGYFEKTQIPAEIAPDKVSAFVRPKRTEKTTAEQSKRIAEPPVQEAKPEPPKKAEAPAPAKPAEKPVESKGNEKPADSPVKASDFIKVVFHHKLTGKEFLDLLGNTKISVQAYREIESNPGLTVKRLIEILEGTSLTSEDYQKLIIATERVASLKEEAKVRLVSEPAKSAPIVPPVSSGNKINLSNLTSPKTMEMPDVGRKGYHIDKTVEVKANNDNDDEEEPEEDETPRQREKREKKKEERKKAKPEEDIDEDFDDDDEDNGPQRKKLLFGRKNREKDYGDDDIYDEDEDEDYDDEGGTRKRSNKGKFIAAAIGAVALIAISLGLRYYFSGSILPTDNGNAIEEETVDEQKIFDTVSVLPQQRLLSVSDGHNYTVGGIDEPKLLKNSAATDRRLLYIRDNSIYIFELIGGQLRQLEIRKYDEGIRLLGMIETEKGIIVVSTYGGEYYSYGYVDAEGTEINGSVKRPETVIELLDPTNPEQRNKISITRLSGVLAKVYGYEGRLIFVTSENIPEGADSSDFNTFMPFASTDSEKTICSAENMFLAPKPSYGTISAVFNMEVGGNVSIGGAAGDALRAAALKDGVLYIGQGGLLAGFNLSAGVEKAESIKINGSFEDFSGIGISEGEIRATTLVNGAAALSVFTVSEGKLTLKSEVDNLGNGETLAATCFNGTDSFVVAENGVCYGVDGENNVISESTLEVTDAKLYPLSSDIALKITPTDEGGKRTGITVSTVKLDGAMTQLASTVINSKTVAKNSLDEYISSPAETDIFTIGSQLDENGSGTVVVPVVYFDGVSEVELFVIYSVNSEGGISVSGSAVDYDRRSKNIFAVVKSGYVISVTDSRITTARADDGSIVGYFDLKTAGREYNYYTSIT